MDLIKDVPVESIDVLITSPPYWGQREGLGIGSEDDPRHYIDWLAAFFAEALTRIKRHGLVWINVGDAYNTPINWRGEDHVYSSLGPTKMGLPATNSAYVKPRLRRRPFVEHSTPWLTYGSSLALPFRLVIALADLGYLFRGEVIWRKLNPMPEGRCRRPHRQHEGIYLFARQEAHQFRVSPPVGSVWDFSPDKAPEKRHFSRFPEELPGRCIDAFGLAGRDVVVFDPFSGSGTTGVAALRRGCSYLGFEIDADQVAASNQRLAAIEDQLSLAVA